MPFADVLGHDRAKSLLQSAIAHDRIAHAYLFHGEDRIGKRLVAVRFAQAVNCDTSAGGDACGTCRSCVQITAGSHPDVLIVQPDPEQANPQIRIERIRDIEQQTIYRPLVGRFKTIVIDDADRMTLGAANALLKTLEEPPSHSLFILVTSRPYVLPATIRSRCQAVRFVPPGRTQVEAALIIQRDMPPADARFLTVMTHARIGEALTADLAALRSVHEDYRMLTSVQVFESAGAVLAAAEALAKGDRGTEALDWLGRWLRDLLLVKVGADTDLLLDMERLTELAQVADGLDTDAILELLSAIDEMERGAARNVNMQIALEALFLRIRDLLAAGSSRRFSGRHG
jgi:DNA polymerase-3 subunit delta'